MSRASFVIPLAAMVLGVSAYGPRASADDLSGVYAGGNFGRARNSYGTGFIDSQLIGAAENSGDTLDYRARSTARMADVWWVNAGYFFTPYIGVDAAFFHLGQIRYIAVGSITESSGPTSFATTTEVTSHGPALSLIFRLPLNESFDVSLRVGDYFGKATLDNNVIVGSESAFTAESKSGSSLLAGIGAAYSFGGHYSVRLDYLRVNDTGDSGTTGKFSINMATVGVSYTF